MTALVDLTNRALVSLGTRSAIASMDENSSEARNARQILPDLIKELLRMAPWNCAFNFNTLALLCSAPGTPENSSPAPLVWSKGLPPPPWNYEYAYPADAVRLCWIVPQFNTGYTGSVPLTSAANTGGYPSYWQGPPVIYKVGIDQIDVNTGLPAVGGADTKVIWTNQPQAILAYIKNVTNPDIFDPQFQEAIVAALAGRLVMALTGDKGLANLKLSGANAAIQIARVGDGNEGLTINDQTPSWIRVRGVAYDNASLNPNGAVFDWGPNFSMYS